MFLNAQANKSTKHAGNEMAALWKGEKICADPEKRWKMTEVYWEYKKGIFFHYTFSSGQ